MTGAEFDRVHAVEFDPEQSIEDEEELVLLVVLVPVVLAVHDAQPYDDVIDSAECLVVPGVGGGVDQVLDVEHL